MIVLRDKRVLAAAVVVAALIVFLLPAFAAFRYTAPGQRNQFLLHPWRGWNFVYAALAVPSDAKLKTSGMALRKAVWLFDGTAVDPREVQLVYVKAREPYVFRHTVGNREITTSVVPRYRFIWQVQGTIDTVSEQADTVVALLDYQTGRILYDVRDDLTAEELATPPGETQSPSPSP